jgi:hypothetical protein
MVKREAAEKNWRNFYALFMGAYEWWRSRDPRNIVLEKAAA